ncbi:MAG: hypothetical protein ACYC6F_12385 [Longimicrobiales bacterium]
MLTQQKPKVAWLNLWCHGARYMDPADGKARIDWFSTLVEVALVLLGLLLAFSGDRLWDAHREHVREAQYLARLHTEFSATVAELDSAIAHQDQVLAAGRAILDALAQPETPDCEERVAEAVPAVFDFWSLKFFTATYDDLKSSGNLELLQSTELRVALAGFDALAGSDVAIGEQLVRDEWLQLVRPYLARTLSSDVYLRPSMREGMGVPLHSGTGRVESVMGDLEFWNLITHRILLEQGRRMTFLEARKVAARVAELTAQAD